MQKTALVFLATCFALIGIACDNNHTNNTPVDDDLPGSPDNDKGPANPTLPDVDIKPAEILPDNPNTPDTFASERMNCLRDINAYRKTLGMPELVRWTDAEKCADQAAANEKDSFGQCGETAAHSCAGRSSIADCINSIALNQATGPASKLAYNSLTSRNFTKIACGFAKLPNGELHSVQKFK